MATEPKLKHSLSLILLHPRVGGSGLIVLLNEPWDFERAGLYESLFVKVLLCQSVLTVKRLQIFGIEYGDVINEV